MQHRDSITMHLCYVKHFSVAWEPTSTASNSKNCRNWQLRASRCTVSLLSNQMHVNRKVYVILACILLAGKATFTVLSLLKLLMPSRKRISTPLAIQNCILCSTCKQPAEMSFWAGMIVAFNIVHIPCVLVGIVFSRKVDIVRISVWGWLFLSRVSESYLTKC